MIHQMSAKHVPEELSVSRLARLLGRALVLRCPHCGRGTVFSSWIRMKESCSKCGLLFYRGQEDNFLGGYLLNLIAAELIIVGVGVIAVLATWPNVPWTGIMYGLVALMVPAPFVTYPYSKTLWLAIDLHFQPAKPSDFTSCPTRS